MSILKYANHVYRAKSIGKMLLVSETLQMAHKLYPHNGRFGLYLLSPLENSPIFWNKICLPPSYTLDSSEFLIQSTGKHRGVHREI